MIFASYLGEDRFFVLFFRLDRNRYGVCSVSGYGRSELRVVDLVNGWTSPIAMYSRCNDMELDVVVARKALGMEACACSQCH